MVCERGCHELHYAIGKIRLQLPGWCSSTYPSTPKERNEKTGLYGFSQLNLSVGYERALSRRLSWPVEPFAKVPLKGVGFFKINLLSAGAFFSLRYKLWRA